MPSAANAAWSYVPDTGEISHNNSGAAWVLNVGADGTNLTVKSAARAPLAPAALPLADAVLDARGREYAIVEIGSSAFEGCANLTGITIPRGVAVIGSRAFYRCLNLSAINVALENKHYSSEAGVLFDKNASALIQYPAAKIGAHIIPDSVASIEDEAFAHCAALQFADIPDSVTNIGYHAFFSCPNLASATLGRNAASVGASTFEKCGKLSAINVAPENKHYSSDAGVLFDKNAETLIFYPNGKAGGCIVPGTVKNIGNNAFANCAALTSVAIPDSVSFIGDYAFFKCGALSSLAIGAGLHAIGSDAFNSCENLADATFDGHCPAVKSFPLYSNSSFATTVWVRRANVASWNAKVRNGPIENGAATWHSHPVRLLPEEPPPDDEAAAAGKTPPPAIPKASWTYDPATAAITHNDSAAPWILHVSADAGGADLTVARIVLSPPIPSHLPLSDPVFDAKGSRRRIAAIGDFAFHKCQNMYDYWLGLDASKHCGTNSIASDFASLSAIASVAIPDSVSAIGNYAFEGCANLGAITIPGSVAKIGSHAFDGCRSLASVDFGNGVADIGDYVFSGCFALTSLAIPESLSTLGGQAFDDCKNLAAVTFQGRRPAIKERFSAHRETNHIADINLPHYLYCAVKSIGFYFDRATIYVRRAHAASWDSGVENGPIKKGAAYWRHNKIRFLPE